MEVDPVANGVVTYSPDNNTPLYDIGTVVTYRCNQGYERRYGDETRTCVDSGDRRVFVGIAPSCENTPPPGKMIELNLYNNKAVIITLKAGL